MARTKRKNSKDGGGIGGALVAICIGIYNWIVGHKEIVFIIVGVVVAIIVVVIIIKRMRFRRYWAWYYSRERGLAELGTHYLLQKETDSVLNNQTQIIDGCGDPAYVELVSARERVYHSEEIVWLEGNSVKYRGSDSPFSGEDLARGAGFQTNGMVTTVYCKTNEDGGYTFLLLPDAIYAFITGDSSYTFVGAYEKKALKLNVGIMHFEKNYTNITDMSHKPRGYFLRYCDIHDSRAAAAGWQYETKDGYRDGRRQGNNIFKVKFIYSKVDFEFGNMACSAAFSCTDSGNMLKDRLEDYKKMVCRNVVTSTTAPKFDEEDILEMVTNGPSINDNDRKRNED